MSRMREWEGRKIYTSNLRRDSVCIWTLNLAPSFLASKWKEETGWVSWLASDKAAYRFSVERNRGTSWFIAKLSSHTRNVLCIFSFVNYSVFAVAVSTAIVTYLVRLKSKLDILWLGCVYVLPLGLKPLTNRKLKATSSGNGLYGENIYIVLNCWSLWAFQGWTLYWCIYRWLLGTLNNTAIG